MIKSNRFITIFLLHLLFLSLVNISFASESEHSLKDQFNRVYKLSFEETTKLGFENNYSVQIAKYNAYISRMDLNRSESIYDALISAEAHYRNNQRENATTLVGSKIIDHDYHVSVTQYLPSGTTLSASWLNNRNETNSNFVTRPVNYDSAIGVSIKQELGRNFFGIQNKGDINMTRLNIANAEFTTFADIERSILEIQQTYWDLVLAQERLRISQSIAEKSYELYMFHKERVEDGFVDEVDAIASQANYQQRVVDVSLAESDFLTVMNRLKFLLNLEGQEDIFIDPSNELTISHHPLDGSSMLKKAFEHRYDYHHMKNILKANNILVKMNEQGLWPEISLEASYIQNAIGTGYGDANSDIINEDHPDFQAGLRVSFPWGNREAKANLQQSELITSQALLKAKQLETFIVTLVLDQVRRVKIFYEASENMNTIAHLLQNKFEQEQKRFDQGRSQTDTLIRFQNDVIESEYLAAQAKHRYKLSLLELNRLTGTVLLEYVDQPHDLIK